MKNNIQLGRIRRQQLDSALRQKLDHSVKEALCRISENGIEEGSPQFLKRMASCYAARTSQGIFFSYGQYFADKKEAREFTVSYFNTHWAATFQKALTKKKYYKTPHGGIVYIPDGEVSHYNEDGAVYGIKVAMVEYFWDFTEELYFDVNRNIYDPYGELTLGSKPRYVRAAYRKLLEVKMRHPNAYLSKVIGNGVPEISINHWSAENVMVMGYSGYHYEGKSYNKIDFPEISTGQSFVPFLGSGKQAYYDFQDGDYKWAAFNTGMAVSDVFLVQSIYKGITKGGLKAMTMGNKPWNHREFWDKTKSYSSFYHSSGFADEGIHIHHSFLKQNLGIGKDMPKFLKHQMFGLKPIPNRFIGGEFYYSRDIHNAIHKSSRILKLNRLQRIRYGTPTWVYPAGTSTLGRGINWYWNE